MWLILGQGYCGTFLADAARARGFSVLGVRREAGPEILAFDDPAAAGAMASASYIVSTIAPVSGVDPVLARYGAELAQSRAWKAWLSSTGVYGDAGGAWVDEASPLAVGGRRAARVEADRQWQTVDAAIFRLPGIYGPGRSALDAVRSGTARRIDRPGHRFSRIHVRDIIGALLIAAEHRLTGVWNLTDNLPAEPAAVTEEACRLLSVEPPPPVALEDAGLSPMAGGFWEDHRLVSGERFLRKTGYRLRYPDYKAGLRAILKEETWPTGC
ncbi:MAG: SDR family NAD(P)-dependent oxidoreductase [Sphingomonadaceae bacterium]